MKTEHYPSLELCQKLTDIGFPVCDHFWQYGKICNSWHDAMIFSEASVCPSVMEMLDVIPTTVCFMYKKINTPKGSITGSPFQEIVYGDFINKNYRISTEDISIPDLLAEMVLWLQENNHISFSK